MAQAFFGGVHPHVMKAATNEKAIEQLAPPAVVVIPMSMHFGAPCTPIVKVGDQVKMCIRDSHRRGPARQRTGGYLRYRYGGG